MTKRLFCLTDYTMDSKWWKQYYDDNENLSYVFGGLETCPTTQRQHWQMFIYYKKPIRPTNKHTKSFEGRHIEACNGSLRDNVNYCSKEGNPAIELGKKPDQGRRSDLDDIKNDIIKGSTEVEIATNNFSKWCQYGRRFEEFRRLIEPKRTWETNVIVRWGGTGTGKSRYCFEAGAIPVEYINGFFGGYNGEDTILLDDFNPAAMPREVFLKMTDRYPYLIQIKGGFRNWKPKTIYITSNYDPDTWYSGDLAIKRRLKNVSEVVSGNTMLTLP